MYVRHVVCRYVHIYIYMYNVWTIYVYASYCTYILKVPNLSWRYAYVGILWYECMCMRVCLCGAWLRAVTKGCVWSSSKQPKDLKIGRATPFFKAPKLQKWWSVEIPRDVPRPHTAIVSKAILVTQVSLGLRNPNGHGLMSGKMCGKPCMNLPEYLGRLAAWPFFDKWLMIAWE